jgi:hypothetical protein
MCEMFHRQKIRVYETCFKLAPTDCEAVTESVFHGNLPGGNKQMGTTYKILRKLGNEEQLLVAVSEELEKTKQLRESLKINDIGRATIRFGKRHRQRTLNKRHTHSLSRALAIYSQLECTYGRGTSLSLFTLLGLDGKG